MAASSSQQQPAAVSSSLQPSGSPVISQARHFTALELTWPHRHTVPGGPTGAAACLWPLTTDKMSPYFRAASCARFIAPEAGANRTQKCQMDARSSPLATGAD